jgi:hypothetical protein
MVEGNRMGKMPPNSPKKIKEIFIFIWTVGNYFKYWVKWDLGMRIMGNM